MITKRIFYKNKGMDNEDYIFLDYDPEANKYSIREGYSYKSSSSLEWDGKEEIYTLDEFKANHPEYIDKVEQLIVEIQSTNNK